MARRRKKSKKIPLGIIVLLSLILLSLCAVLVILTLDPFNWGATTDDVSSQGQQDTTEGTEGVSGSDDHSTSDGTIEDSGSGVLIVTDGGDVAGSGSGSGGIASDDSTTSSYDVSLDSGTSNPPHAQEYGPIGRICFVIDDVGNSSFQLQPFLDLDLPITFAVMPGLAYSETACRRLVAAGREIILHLPMEAENEIPPGPKTILTGMSVDTVRSVVEDALSLSDRFVGVNNHMGSAVTQDPDLLRPFFEVLRREGLFFLDSRTTDRTVARMIAAEYGVPFVERDVFLDNSCDRAAIELSMERVVAEARLQGYAVAIGHATCAELPAVIENEARRLRDEGFLLVTVSQLIESLR